LFYAQEADETNEKLEKTSNVLLDPNHTHFILVDDGSEGQFGKEIEFRALLEAELRKGKSLRYYESKRLNQRKKMTQLSSNSNTAMVFNNDNYNNNNINEQTTLNESVQEENEKSETVPMILIVVQGGPNTLITVEHSLKQAVPVLVLAVILIRK
jgi:hypothetical protein